METFSPILTKDKPQLCFFFKPFLTNNKCNESIELVHNVVSLSLNRDAFHCLVSSSSMITTRMGRFLCQSLL